MEYAHAHPVSADHLKAIKKWDGGPFEVLNPRRGVRDPELRRGTRSIERRFDFTSERAPDEVSLVRATVTTWGQPVPRSEDPDGFKSEIDKRLVWIFVEANARFPIMGKPCLHDMECQPLPEYQEARAATYVDARTGKPLRTISF